MLKVAGADGCGKVEFVRSSLPVNPLRYATGKVDIGSCHVPRQRVDESETARFARDVMLGTFHPNNFTQRAPLMTRMAAKLMGIQAR